MGGDEPPHILFEAVLQYKKKIHPDITLVVIAKEKYSSEIEFLQADEVILPDDSVFQAVRKRKSSMALGIQALREKKLDALVTTGNTGALVTLASLLLPKLSSIQKPALLVMLPTLKGNVAVLDVGANIGFKSSHLLDYAKLGIAYRMSFDEISSPKIGLLNIGQEEQKGTPEIKETYSRLQSLYGAQFLGNIEGREVFEGKVDVLITDAFTGNVFLKTCEGASSFLLKFLNTERSSVLNKFSYAEHPGALLAGMDGVIVKCHGYSDAKALQSGIEGAIQLVQKDVLQKMKLKLGQSQQLP